MDYPVESEPRQMKLGLEAVDPTNTAYRGNAPIRCPPGAICASPGQQVSIRDGSEPSQEISKQQLTRSWEVVVLAT